MQTLRRLKLYLKVSVNNYYKNNMRELGYDEYEVEVLDGYIDAVEKLGFNEFIKQFG